MKRWIQALGFAKSWSTNFCRPASNISQPGFTGTTPTTKDLRIRLNNMVATPSTTGEEVIVPTDQSQLPARRMLDSVQTALIPIQSQPKIRNKYLNFMGGVRFGRVLEDLDTFAVWLSYTHNNVVWANGGHAPYSIFTAQVDKIVLQEPQELMKADSDLMLIGNVTWVGNSSLETSMKLQQQEDQQWKTILSAKFLMVARNPYQPGPAAVCPLIAETPFEEEIISEGERAKAKRQMEASRSLLKYAPNAEETALVHEMFTSTLDSKSGSFRRRTLPAGAVWMEDATLKTLVVTQPQERNLYNKVFGGFLMRKGFELAWANACLFSKSRPILEIIDDIVFHAPIEIGSVLFLSSQVVYTEGSHIQVRVYVESMSPHDGTRHVTNTLHMTFRSENVPCIHPKTYGEAMLYIEGKRHFEDCIKGMNL